MSFSYLTEPISKKLCGSSALPVKAGLTDRRGKFTVNNNNK